MAGVEIGFAGVLGEAIPGTHELAVVAAENAVADAFAQVFGNAAFVFDGQVGNAAPGIQFIGRHNGVGGADGDAGFALAAMVFAGSIHRQGNVGVDLAQKEPAARFPVQHQGVLALPAQPGFRRQRFFHYRGAVHKSPSQLAVRHGLTNAPGQNRQALADQLVIVTAQGIAGYIGLVFLLQQLHRLGVRGQVIHARGNHPQGARFQLPGAKAFVAVGRHPVHLPLITFCQPRFQLRFFGVQIRIGNTDLLEAEFAAPLLDLGFQLIQIHDVSGQPALVRIMAGNVLWRPGKRGRTK